MNSLPGLAIGLPHFLILSGLLFGIGLFGVLAKRNAVMVLVSIELMMNAVNINLVAFNRFVTPAALTGQIWSLFVIAVAAAEVGVGLALIIAIYRSRLSIDLDEFNLMKW